MVKKGAKYVILASRNPPAAAIQSVMNDMNTKGANIVAVQLDVGNFEECKQLLEIKLGELEFPAVKGVMHAAGSLADGIIINQEWPRLCSTFRPKVSGTLNLHELTKHLNLEHFVLFSSVAAMFGLPGQSNHSAGNFFEDACAHYRNSIGLPGTTINWGQWGEVGIAKELDIAGIKPISTAQGIAALEYVLKTQQRQLSVLNVGSFNLMSKLVPQLSSYMDERCWKAFTKSNFVTTISAEFWQSYDSASDVEVKTTLLKESLRSILRNTLRLDENDAIEDHANIQEIGVDSLMFVELRNHIQVQMKDRLLVGTGALQNHHSLNILAETLMTLIEAGNNDGTPNEHDLMLKIEHFSSSRTLLSHTLYHRTIVDGSWAFRN